MRPGVGGRLGGGVRRVFQHVVLRIGGAVDHRLDLAADCDERLAEPVQLVLGLALGWLDHHRARDRERHGRCVKPIVHQTLGDIELGDPMRLERAQVEDELMRHPPVGAGVQHVVV